MKSIKDLPQEFQNIFAEIKAEQEAEQSIDGSQIDVTDEDIKDEVELLKTKVTGEDVEEDGEGEEVDMEFTSQELRAIFK
jgi:hypothetical protein